MITYCEKKHRAGRYSCGRWPGIVAKDMLSGAIVQPMRCAKRIPMAVRLGQSPCLSGESHSPRFVGVPNVELVRWQETGNGFYEIEYMPIARGTAIVETRTHTNGRRKMTAFFRDGPELEATHYCNAGI